MNLIEKLKPCFLVFNEIDELIKEFKMEIISLINLITQQNQFNKLITYSIY